MLSAILKKSGQNNDVQNQKIEVHDDKGMERPVASFAINGDEAVEHLVSPLLRRAQERTKEIKSDPVPEESAPPARLTRENSFMIPETRRQTLPMPRSVGRKKVTMQGDRSPTQHVPRAVRNVRQSQRELDRDVRVVPAQTPNFSWSLGLSKNTDRKKKLCVLTNAVTPPNVDRTQVGLTKPVKEWRLMPLSVAGQEGDIVNLMIKDTRRCHSIVTRHLSPFWLEQIELLVEKTGLRSDSPADFFTGNADAEEIIAGMMVQMSKMSASDVKVREPDPTKDVVDDEHIVPYVPCSLGQFNWPVYNQVPEICVTTEFSPNESIATYQKWIIGHEQYTPLGFPYIQRFIPSVNPDGIKPYSFDVHGISGVSRSMEANHSGVIVSCVGDHLEGIYDDKIKQQTELANAHILELNLHALATTLSK